MLKMIYQRFDVNDPDKLQESDNPREEIRISSQTGYEALLEPFNINKINYLATFPNGTGACELWGHRLTQEDRIIAGNLEHVTQADWQRLLQNTIKTLQENITNALPQFADYQGSCLCVNIITHQQI